METCSVVLTFESVDEILWCDHRNETSSAVLLHGIICFSIFYKIKFRIFLNFDVWHLFIYNKYLDRVVHSANAGLSRALFKQKRITWSQKVIDNLGTRSFLAYKKCVTQLNFP